MYARERFKRGINEGKPAEPWKNRSRDFNEEAREEIADCYNYVTWGVQAGQIPAGLEWLLKYALALVYGLLFGLACSPRDGAEKGHSGRERPPEGDE